MASKTYDVIIIGCGLAGLTASVYLTKLGYQVCALEARNRLGGRLHSQVLDGQYFELGAAYLQGSGDSNIPNPLLSVLKHYNIHTTPLDPLNSDFFNAEGGNESLAEWLAPLREAFEKANTLIQDAKLIPRTTQPSLSTILGYGPQIPPKDSKEFKARQIITNTILRNTGATPSEVSLLELMHDETFVGADALILNGSNKLIEGLQQECEATQNFSLFLNSNVQVIHHSTQDSLGRVQTETGEEYQGTAILSAVPLGVLKKYPFRFQPNLSKEKQKAIQHLRLGEQNHVILEFKKAFWPENRHYLYPNHTDVNQWPEYINLAPFTSGRPILMANVFGQAAKFFKQKESDIIERILAPLKKVYKSSVTQPIQVRISRWDSDHFTAGGIPYCGLLSTEEDLLAIQTPEHQGLYFAGDYTRRGQKNNLSSAYDSGLQAALEIDAYLKHKDQFRIDVKAKKRP